MKRLVLALFILINVSMLSAFAKRDVRPLWCDDETIEQVYPSSKYIARTGHGSTPEAAALDAHANLSAYFQLKINNSVSGTQFMTEKDTAWIQRRLDRITTTTSDVELFAVNKTESYRDRSKKTYYVCAYIPRKQAFSIYEPKLRGSQSSLNGFLSMASKESDTINKINFLFSALESGLQYQYDLSFAELLDVNEAEKYSQDRNRIALIPAEIQRLLKTLSARVVPLSDEAKSFVNTAAQLARSAGFSVADNGEYSLELLVNPNKQYFDQTIVAYPDLSLSLKDRNGNVKWTVSQTLNKINGFKDAESLLDSKISKEVLAVLPELPLSDALN